MAKRKREEKEPKPRKMSRYEIITVGVMQDYAHQNTAVINSKRRILQCESDEIERGLAQLTAAISQMKERRKIVDALMKGLAAVVEKR